MGIEKKLIKLIMIVGLVLILGYGSAFTAGDKITQTAYNDHNFLTESFGIGTITATLINDNQTVVYQLNYLGLRKTGVNEWTVISKQRKYARSLKTYYACLEKGTKATCLTEYNDKSKTKFTNIRERMRKAHENQKTIAVVPPTTSDVRITIT